MRANALLALALASACADPASPGIDAGADAGPGCGEDVEPAGVAWEDCHDGRRCTTIEVPLDHEAPGGETISVRIARIPAACPGARRGVLTFNPGGPGNPGIEAGLAAIPLLQTLAPRLRREFDVVLFDPRGIGESTPLDCVDDAWLAELRSTVPLEPDSDAEWMALDAAFAELAAGCAASAPELITHLSTEDVARDLEVVRSRLGVERWDYLGVSYGTVLGSTYATLFPDRVRAFVLDSAMILGPDVVTTYREPAEAYDAELGRFAESCGADATCPFHGGEGAPAVIAAYDALEAAVDAGSLTGGGRTVGTIDLAAAATAALRSGNTTLLAQLLADAEDGDASALMAQADALFLAGGLGAYPSWLEALTAVIQADNVCPPGFDLAALRDAWAAAQSYAPRIGVFLQLWVHAAACLHWPVRRDRPPLAISAPSAPPLLVLGGRHDPATPIARGEALRDALGNGSHFVAYEGAGHGYVGLSQCARDAEIAFLLDPSTPPAVTSCAPD